MVLDGVTVVDVVDEMAEPTVVVVARIDADGFGVDGFGVDGFGVVLGEAVGPSGEVQSVGGTPDPVCPGIRTVPAQPKLEKVASRVTELPSVKPSVDLTWRINPALSIDTMAVFEV